MWKVKSFYYNSQSSTITRWGLFQGVVHLMHGWDGTLMLVHLCQLIGVHQLGLHK